MRRKHARRHLNTKGKLFFAALFFLFGFLFFQFSFAPVLRASAENEAKRLASEAINDAVSAILHENDPALSGYISPAYDAEGAILGMTTDMAGANLLKEEIIARVNESLGGETREVQIPVGTLLGSEWLYGRGPEIPLRLVLAGNVSAEFDSEFLSAGINQTQYRLYIDVKASVYTFLPGVRGTTEVETNVLAAETILVGEVPRVFANIGLETEKSE